jgi:hypothetical protein
MSADEIRLPSPEAIAMLAGRELSELDRLALLDKLVAEHTAAAQAYVGDLHRLRRATIRDIVDGEATPNHTPRLIEEGVHRRRGRIEVVAKTLGISVTQVYQAIRADTEKPREVS